MGMDVRKKTSIAWLLLTFTLPTKRASQRVEVWRKLQRYGTVPLGNSGYMLPSDSMNEERFQWLATAIRKYGGDASVVRVHSIDNISTPQLAGRFAEARAREYQELIRDFIDPKARFAFAPEERVPPASVPFDMFHGGFGHRGDNCTFEVLQKDFRIRDRRTIVISEVIHDADLADDKFGRKEGYGIDEVLKGWARQGIPDQELLDRGMQLIEGLYHSLA